MTLLTVLIVLLVVALLLRALHQIITAVGYEPDGRPLARTKLPVPTLLPRGCLSYPRPIDRRWHGTPSTRSRVRPLAMLGLAAAGLLALGLLHDDEKRDAAPPAVAASQARSRGLGAVGMPGVLPGNHAVRPLSVAVMFDDTDTATQRTPELRKLGAWLQLNHDPRTRVTVIDRTSRRTTPRLTATQLGASRNSHSVTSLRRAVRAALPARPRDRLLVTLDHHDLTTAGAGVAALRLHSAPAAPLRRALALAPGDRASAIVDIRRPGALAATIARAVISVSGMREKR